MLKNLNRRILVIALLLGLVASYMVYSYINRVEETFAVPAEMQPVVTAAQTIPAHVRVTRDMVELTEMPAEYIVAGSFTSLDEVVGGISKVELIRGEQVAKSRVYHGEREAAFAYLVPDNMRAVAVSVSEVIAVGNLVRPRDRVDVLVTYSGDPDRARREVRTLTLLQNVEILAVGQVAEPEEAVLADRGFGTVTLALEPDRVQVITLAEQVGSLKLSLRSPLDRRVVPLEPVLEDNLTPLT